MGETTTIQISVENRDELKKLKELGEDYNSIIGKLIKEHNLKKDRKKIEEILESAKGAWGVDVDSEEYVNRIRKSSSEADLDDLFH